MANEEHLKILRQGVAGWNEWREHSDINPDLREADLYKADLSEANLSWADLSGANLTWAQLIETDLGKAILTESRVYGASVWSIRVDEQTSSGT
jgi:uncharacterized protein YjbI with pentapeptide repeats